MSPAALDRRTNPYSQDVSARSLFVIRIAGVGLSVGLGLGIAKWLGAEASGIYYLFLSITLGGALLSRRGLDIVALKNISIDLDEGAVGRAYGSWVYCCRRAMLNTAILIALAIFIWILLPRGIIGISYKVLWCVVLAIPLQAVHMINVGALRGGGKQGLAAALEVIVIPLTISVGAYLISFFFVVNSYTPIVLYVIGILISLLIGGVKIWGWFRGEAMALPDPDTIKSVSASFFAVGLSAFIIDWSSTFALAAFSSVEEIGVYNVCFRIVALGGLVLSIFNNLHAPRFAVSFKAGEFDVIGEVARKGAQGCFVIGCLTLFPVFFFPELLLGLLGDDFLAGVPVIRVMILAQLFNMFTGSVGYLLLMSGNESVLKRISYSCLALQVIMLVPATAMHGILGAAFTWSIISVVRNVVTMYYTKRMTGITVVPSFLYMLYRLGAKC